MADPTVITAGCVSRSPGESRVTLAHITSEHDTDLYGAVHGGAETTFVATDAAGRARPVPARDIPGPNPS
ncbi:hypothetical protein [Streptomyces sp. NPDC054849]